MEIQISNRALDQLLSEALTAHPRECCGMLLGSGERVTQTLAAANVHETPLTHFEIDPAALIAAHKAARGGAEAIIGYYHSHPNGLALPSATDAAMAARDGKIWAIIAQDGVTFWRDLPDGFTRLSYTAVPG